MVSNECSKCRSTDLRRSRIHNIVEWVVSPLIVAYRCKLCDWREFKFRMMVGPVERTRPVESKRVESRPAELKETEPKPAEPKVTASKTIAASKTLAAKVAAAKAVAAKAK